MSKSEYSIKPNEFNELKDYLDENNISYIITEFPCSIKLETNSSIFNVSLTGEEDVILNMGNIANAFYTKCKVHYLKDQYGYTETYDHLGKKHITWEVKTAAGYHYENEYYKLTIKGKEKVLGNFHSKNKIDIHLGDKIKVSGIISEPTNPTLKNTFNYKKYLNNKNIYHIIKIDSIKVISKNKNIYYIVLL